MIKGRDFAHCHRIYRDHSREFRKCGTKFVVGASSLVISLILLMPRNCTRGSVRPNDTSGHLPICIRDR